FLDRPDAQLVRALLRSAELWPGSQSESDARTHPDQPRMVPSESSAALHQVGPAQQYQYPAIGIVDRHEPGGEEQGPISGELLDEEQTRDREGQERPALCLGSPGGAAA